MKKKKGRNISNKDKVLENSNSQEADQLAICIVQPRS